MAGKIKNLGVYRSYKLDSGEYYGSYFFIITIDDRCTGYAFDASDTGVRSITRSYENAKRNNTTWVGPEEDIVPGSGLGFIVPIELILNLE